MTMSTTLDAARAPPRPPASPRWKPPCHHARLQHQVVTLVLGERWPAAAHVIANLAAHHDGRRGNPRSPRSATSPARSCGSIPAPAGERSTGRAEEHLSIALDYLDPAVVGWVQVPDPAQPHPVVAFASDLYLLTLPGGTPTTLAGARNPQ